MSVSMSVHANAAQQGAAGGPVVSLQGPSSPSTNTTIVPCWSNYEINVDEEEYEGGPDNNFISQRSGGPWITEGVPADVWVERILDFGTLSPGHDPGTGRLQLNVTRQYGINQTGIGSKTTIVTFNVYDAASGGNLIDSNQVVFNCVVNSP